MGATASATKNVLVSSVNAVLDGAKTLAAAVIAGGSVALLVVVLICAIGILVGSAYGIFFLERTQEAVSRCRWGPGRSATNIPHGLARFGYPALGRNGDVWHPCSMAGDVGGMCGQDQHGF